MLPTSFVNYLLDAYNRLVKNGNNDEFLTTIHGDLRANNICYNENTSKLAIIDWEKALLGNVYAEFVPVAPCSQRIPYDFMVNLIDEYNKISQIKLDKQKLKDLYIVGSFDEYGRVAFMNNFDISEFYEYQYPKIITSIQEIETAFKDNKSSINCSEL